MRRSATIVTLLVGATLISAAAIWMVSRQAGAQAHVYENAIQMISYGSPPNSNPVLFLTRSDGSAIRRLVVVPMGRLALTGRASPSKSLQSVAPR
jgi:hypothetical protein